MSEKKKIIITIARQYGSGGADTGKKLAEDLGISFYDKNILRMNSDESGIKESYFHLADEKAGNRLLYKIINTLTPEKGAPSFGSDLISADNLFRFQSEVIPEAGGGGILRHHRPLRGLCAGRHRGTDSRVPLRGYQGARGARA